MHFCNMCMMIEQNIMIRQKYNKKMNSLTGNLSTLFFLFKNIKNRLLRKTNHKHIHAKAFSFNSSLSFKKYQTKFLLKLPNKFSLHFWFRTQNKSLKKRNAKIIKFFKLQDLIYKSLLKPYRNLIIMHSMDSSSENDPLSDKSIKKSDNQASVQQLELQLQFQNNPPSLLQSVNFTSEITDWDFYASYTEFFQDTTIQSFSINQILTDQVTASILKSSLKEELKKNGFILMKPTQTQDKAQNRQYQDQIDIKISYSTPSFDVVQVFCQVRSLAKKYTVLNQKSQSFRHENKIIGKGAFGQIFQCKCSNQSQKFVVKCLRFDFDTVHLLKKHIKEFFICDTMSALEIGPQILRTNGFDFIVFQNCLEFEMQMCQQFKKSTFQKNVKQNLFKMHLIQMVHCDLKPQNVMFSPKLKKNVILDYGVSRFTEDKWGQKSLSFFRGTFEYCSDEMKQLFFQENMNQIDLFKNDVCMAKKTITQSKNMDAFQMRFLRDYQNGKQCGVRDENSIKEIPYEFVFKFYYFLYKNIEQTKNPIKQIQQFLTKLSSVCKENKKISILLTTIVFASKLNSQIYEKLYCNILELSAKYSFLKLFYLKPPYQMVELLEYLPYSIKAEEIMKPFTFQKIYFELQDYVYSSLLYKLYFHSSEGFNPWHMARNLSYVLSKAHQLKRFTDEECFSFYLKYCSFWEPSCEITVRQKDEISAQFIFNIKNKFQPEKSPYLQSKYLPESFFVKNQCKNIVIMYAFLLQYCITGDFSQFKENYAPLILKDCIILGFQYFNFLPNYISKYFEKVIEARSKKIITLIVIQFVQLNILTQNHFLYTTETKPLYEGKIYEFWSHKVFEQIISFFELSVNPNEYYYRKLTTLKFLFSQMLYRSILNLQLQETGSCQQRYMEAFNNLIHSVEEQFLSQNITEILKMSEKALRYILSHAAEQKGQNICQNIALNLDMLHQVCVEVKRSNNFNLFPLFKLDPAYQNHEYKRNLGILDKRINCSQISMFFSIVYRKKEAQADLDKKKVVQLIKLAVQSSGCPSFNYILIIRMFPVYQTLELLQPIKEKKELFHVEYNQMMQKLLKLFKRLICIFRQDNKTTDSLVECLLYLDNLNRANINLIYEERFQIAAILEEISLPMSHQIFLILWANTLIHLYPQNCLNYLKARKKFLELYLQFKIKQRSGFIPKRVGSIQRSYFESVIIENSHWFDQILQFWQLRRLKFMLDQHYYISVQLKPLSQIFIRNRMFKEYAQLLAIYCSRNLTMYENVYEIQNLCNTHYLVLFNQNARKQLLQHLLTSIDNIKNKYADLSPNFLMFYICTLSLDNQLSNDLVKWKKLLYEMYNIYLRLFKIKSKQIPQIIFITCTQFVLILSVMYLKFKCVGKRKFILMVRRLLKSIGIQNRLFKMEIIIYFDQFMSYVNFNPSQVKERKIKIKKIHQKIRLFIRNCKVPYELENQTKKQQFVDEYNLTFQTQKQSDNINKFDLEMMQRYQIKDLTLFTMYKATCDYFCLRMIQMNESQMNDFQKRNICKKLVNERTEGKRFMIETEQEDPMIWIKYFHSLEMMERKINLIKESEEYMLCEESLVIIDKILSIEKENMLSELKKKGGFRENHLIQWI